jgi:hypothetical protein
VEFATGAEVNGNDWEIHFNGSQVVGAVGEPVRGDIGLRNSLGHLIPLNGTQTVLDPLLGYNNLAALTLVFVQRTAENPLTGCASKRPRQWPCSYDDFGRYPLMVVRNVLLKR